MDTRNNQRHNSDPPNSSWITNDNTKPKWLNFAALFLIQFLLSQLVLSYGVYTVYNIQENIHILNCFWPPLILLASSKICYPWIRDITESYYEIYFRQFLCLGLLICTIGVACCFMIESLILQSIFYGGFGGFGSSLALSMIHCNLYDKYPYQVNLIQGIQHVAIASGLFLTPHLIQFLLNRYSISWVYLIHAALLLQTLPAAFLFDKKNVDGGQKLTTFSIYRSNDMYDADLDADETNVSDTYKEMRSWRSLSDNIQFEYIEEDATNDSPNEPNPSTQLERNISIAGVDILPQIIEESEDELDTNPNSKRNSMLMNNNLKRMSVISCKLEELITRNEGEHEQTNEIIKEMKVIDGTIKEKETESAITEYPNTKHCCCCSTCIPSHKVHRRVKYFSNFIYSITCKPIISAVCVIEFFPCLLTNIHSMLSPLIFFNLIAFKRYQSVDNINRNELSFMFSITAFAYLVFLIALPCISSFSKRNLKYLYICGCLISALGVYVFLKSKVDNYHVISCLIYGFGFGIESFLKQILLKESLGPRKWSKIEGTLEFLSGLLVIGVIIVIREVIEAKTASTILDYRDIMLYFLFCTHMTIFSIWIILPFLISFRDLVLARRRDSYNFAMSMQIS